jgi:ribosome-associated protein
VEGYQEGSWVLMDYGIVIVHIFHPETREYYDLDSLLNTYPVQRVAPLESASASASG